MAVRKETITITRPQASERAEGRQAADTPDQRPRNLPPVSVPTEGFSLLVDGKSKSHYPDAAAAFEAGLALKRAYPVVQVMVYDAVEKTRTMIESPDANAPAA